MAEEVHFMGILANVDKTILKLKLENGFKAKVMKGKKGINFLSRLENVPERDLIYYLRRIGLSGLEKEIYFIDNSLQIGESRRDWQQKSISLFDRALYHGYLVPALKLMRLYKEGSVFMPMYYYYTFSDGYPHKSFFGHSFFQGSLDIGFSLKRSEMDELELFISQTQLPFKQPFLRSAFEYFELSYKIPGLNHAFMTLLMGIETLFSANEEELRYRVSRNCAVLLGKDEKNSLQIFKDMKIYFDKSSKIVHAGGPEIDKKDFLILRHYLRESIRLVHKMNVNKEKLLRILNLQGFGQSPLN